MSLPSEASASPLANVERWALAPHPARPANLIVTTQHPLSCRYYSRSAPPCSCRQRRRSRADSPKTRVPFGPAQARVQHRCMLRQQLRGAQLRRRVALPLRPLWVEADRLWPTTRIHLFALLRTRRCLNGRNVNARELQQQLQCFRCTLACSCYSSSARLCR